MQRKGLQIFLGLVAVLFLVVYAGASWFFAGVLVASPTQTLAGSRDSAAALGLGLDGFPPPEEITIVNGDVELAGWYLDNPAGAGCGSVLLHGYTSTRYGALQYAPYFWERGCDLLLYDARAHGESGGRFHTYGYYEKQDAATAVAWLAERSELAVSDIGVIGVSYGAATALQLIPLEPDLAFVLADSAYQDLLTIASFQGTKRYGEWLRVLIPGVVVMASLRADFNMLEASPQEAVVGAETPLLLIHALEDSFTTAEHSERIYARSNPETTVLHITDWGAAHGRSVIEDPEAYWALVDEFLAAYAPGYGVAR